MTDVEILEVSKGSRLTLSATWAGGDFTGDVLDVLDEAMTTHQYVTVSWQNPATGTFLIVIDEDLHTAKDVKSRTVRLRKTSPSGPVAFELFRMVLV
jgi:inner membrane protein involved in colicin E2 resistance